MSEGSVQTVENNIVVATKMNNNWDESQFPDGMRVLLVDDSVVCLKILTALLKKCRYQVTPKENSMEALMLLKQKEESFDIVVTNVHMHEIDGFKLLEAGLELDIPVIMTSTSDSKDIIMKGISHGARDYLIKPLRIEELKNIWQHVYRKKLIPTTKETCPNVHHEHGAQTTKRKSTIDGHHDHDHDRDFDDHPPKAKKERINWNQPLHDKFVEAVINLGGVDKAVPKKILEMMGSTSFITREKVASHLQKYRKAIKKTLEIENLPSQAHAESSMTAVPSNYMQQQQQQQQINMWLFQNHGVYQPQPLQVGPRPMIQQPWAHLDRNLASRPNPLLAQIQQQQRNLKGEQLFDCPSIIDPLYDPYALNNNFLDVSCPSLFDDF